MNQNSSQLHLDQSFGDIGQFSQAIGWDLDFRQLEVGGLEAGVTAISGNHVRLFRFNFNRRFHQVGCSPDEEMTFGVIDPGTQNVSWCSEVLSGGALTNFNLGSGFDCVSEPGFIAYGISIESGLFRSKAERLGLSENFEGILNRQLSWNSLGTLNLAKKLNALFRDAQGPGNAIREHSETLDDEIPQAIFEAINSKHSSSLLPDSNTKGMILKKALEVVNNPDEIPISVSHLCERIGTSSSTLNRIFISEFGVSPKSYIRFRCLSAVRDTLSCSPPGTKVADVANRWGFWHMGQFATDYQSMFKELPSTTLRRN